MQIRGDYFAALLLCAYCALGTVARADTGNSQFTDLQAGCNPIDDQGNFHRWLCTGLDGYQPIVMQDNLRENLAIMYNGNVMPMLFFAKVSAAPSKLMDAAEWRFSNPGVVQPTALIVGLLTDTNNDQSLVPPGTDNPPDSTDPAPGTSASACNGGDNAGGGGDTPPPDDTHLIWVIIKLDPTQSCVIDSIDGTDPNSHEAARKVADQAQDWGCV